MNNNKIVYNSPIILNTKINDSVYHYKTEFSIYLNGIYLDLTANIKLKMKAQKNLISFEDSLLTRIMGLRSLCCTDHARTCLTDSVNPELVALGLQPLTLKDCKVIQVAIEKEISYFINSKLELLTA